jgi:hypothetical protein
VEAVGTQADSFAPIADLFLPDTQVVFTAPSKH